MFTQDSDPITDMKIGIEPEIQKWIENTPDYKCALSNTITREDYLWICINNGRYKKNDDYIRYLIDHNIGVNYKACEFACSCFREELSRHLINKLITMKTLSIGEITPIDASDIQRVKKFIFESAHDHLNYGRTLSKTKKDIMTGKLGEVAIARMLVRNGFECSSVSFKNQKFGDGGIDLIVNGKSVQVKSTTYHTPQKLCIPISDKDLKADVYVLVQVNENKNFVKFLGAITRDEIVDKKLLQAVYDTSGIYGWASSNGAGWTQVSNTTSGQWLATSANANSVSPVSPGNLKYYYVDREHLRSIDESFLK